MKKNFNKYNDEINLIEAFSILWKAKIKIFLITIIFFFIWIVKLSLFKKYIYKFFAD